MDVECVEGEDKHIKAAQDLLKMLFPGVSGLQPTVYGPTGQ